MHPMTADTSPCPFATYLCVQLSITRRQTDLHDIATFFLFFFGSIRRVRDGLDVLANASKQRRKNIDGHSSRIVECVCYGKIVAISGSHAAFTFVYGNQFNPFAFSVWLIWSAWPGPHRLPCHIYNSQSRNNNSKITISASSHRVYCSLTFGKQPNATEYFRVFFSVSFKNRGHWSCAIFQIDLDTHVCVCVCVTATATGKWRWQHVTPQHSNESFCSDRPTNRPIINNNNHVRKPFSLANVDADDWHFVWCFD